MHPRVCLWLQISLLPLLFLLAVTAGRCGPVSMDAHLGFDGNAKPTMWTPVAIRLANAGTEQVEGRIISHDSGAHDTMSQCMTKVTLPPNSRKLYHVYFKSPNYSSVRIFRLIANNGKVLATIPAGMASAGPQDPLVVSVGPRSSSLHFLNGEPIVLPQGNPPGPPAPYAAPPGVPGPSTAKIVTASIDPADLPDRASAYQGVTALVLTDFSPDSASPKALKAISMWVASGGLLIVTGGADYRRLQNDFYNELLPVDVTGATDASLDYVGCPSGVVAATECRLKPGVGEEIISGAFPLVSARRYVAGRVVFIAFDTRADAFNLWNAQTKFWKRIVNNPTGEPLFRSASEMRDVWQQYGGYSYGYGQSRGMGYNSISEAIQGSPLTKTPSISILALFLAAYLIALVPVNYTILRVKRRLELAWITTPAIILFFTIGAYAIGYSTKGGRLLINQVTIVEASSGSRYARRMTDALVFSPRRRAYEVGVADSYGLYEAIQQQNQGSLIPAFVEDEGCSVDDLRMAMWSSQLLESIGGTDLGGSLDHSITFTGTRLEGEIRNNTGVDLRDCVIYFRGGLCPVRSLRAGSGTNVKGRLHLAVEPQEGNLELDACVERSIQDTLLDSDTPVLIGFSRREDRIFALKNARESGKAITCYAFRLENSRTTAAARLPEAIPAGRKTVLQPSYWDTTSGRGYSGSATGTAEVDISSGTQLTVHYNCTNQRVTAMKYTGAIAKSYTSGAKVDVRFYNRRGRRWEQVTSSRLVQPASQYVTQHGEIMVLITPSPNSSLRYRIGELAVWTR